MRRSGLVAALALLLGGCAILHSPRPLIARSDPAAGVAPGRYRAYALFDPDQARALDAEARAHCIDSGHSGIASDGSGRGPPLAYCPFDTETGEASPVFRLVAARSGLRVEGPADFPKGAHLLRFERLTDMLLLLQLSADPSVPRSRHDPPGKGATYGLLRRSVAGFELHFVPCDDGMRTTSREVMPSDGSPPPPPLPAEPEPPPPALECEIASLDALRLEALAYGAQAATVPAGILRRIGD